MSALQPVCPVGQVLVNGSQCLSATNPVCSGGGSFDGELDFCWTALAPVCDQGSYDSIAGLCVLAPSCPGGTLNRTTDLCEAAAADGCGSYAFDAALGLCYSPPVCDSGAYDPVTNTCIASLARDCGSYVWSRDELTCLQGVTCPQDPAFPAAAAYSENLDVCLSAAQHDCPAGTSYTPLPVGSCEAVPVCSGDGIYKPETDGCFEGLNLCPLGKEYACMEQGGDMVCSPNPCFDPAAPGAEVTSTLDQSMLQDDGPRDSEGRCLAQLFIFNGKASRCRPPGMTVGLLNDCCESDQVAAEDMGGSLQNAAQGIQIAYEIGQVAYYGNALATGAAQISAISTGTAGAVTSMTVVTAGGTTTTLSGAAATGAYATMASGTTGASALSAGLQAYAGALLNPATIAVAVAVAVVMKMLMGSGCDQGDIQAGMQEAARDCHYVGDYCEKKWPLVGCVQKARSYCCFNSKMARIIQEQGRPQLLAFQPGGAWGAPEQANCRGFTPDEFQVLDFSHIDLSEYFADVQKDLVTRIQGSQETIRQNIESRYQAMPK
jgi:conjugal transfer mating pair stabilization protein TraN